MKIRTAKYRINSNVELDSEQYEYYDDMKIKNTVENKTGTDTELAGKVEILDENDNVVDVVKDHENIALKDGESRSLEFDWNLDDILAGTYKVKSVWKNGDEVVASSEKSFVIISDGEICSSLTTDKKQYGSNENVNITETIENYMYNSIEDNLIAKLTIKNSNGMILMTKEDKIQQLIQDDSKIIKNIWNTMSNTEGTYTAELEIVKNDEKQSESSASFEIVSDNSKITGKAGITGNVDIPNKEISNDEDVKFNCILTNTGNIPLNNVTAKINVISSEDDNEETSIDHIVDLDISEMIEYEETWTHDKLDEGIYKVIFTAVLNNCEEVPISSSYIEVTKSSPLENEAFKNTIFCSSESDNLCMYLNSADIKGDIRTNKLIEFSGTKLNIDGTLKSTEESIMYGQDINIKSEQTTAACVAMPDVFDEIENIISKKADVSKDGLMITEYGEGISLDKSQISRDYIQINGGECSINGSLIADGNISFNLDKLNASKSNGTIIASKDGDVSFSLTDADINGLIYAPNGTVSINVNQFNFKGSIIAKKIIINCTDFKAEYSNKYFSLIE